MSETESCLVKLKTYSLHSKKGTVTGFLQELCGITQTSGLCIEVSLKHLRLKAVQQQLTTKGCYLLLQRALSQMFPGVLNLLLDSEILLSMCVKINYFDNILENQQSPGGVLQKSCNKIFCKILRKIPVAESLFQ